MSLRHGLQAVVRVVRRRVQQQAQQAARLKTDTAAPSSNAAGAPAKHSGSYGVRAGHDHGVLHASKTNFASRASQVWRLASGPRFTQANGSRILPSSRPALPLLLGFAGVGFVSRESHMMEENGERYDGFGSSGRKDLDLETAIHLVRAVFRDHDSKSSSRNDGPAAEFPTEISGYAFSQNILAKGTEGVVYAARKRDGVLPSSDDEDTDLADPNDGSADSDGLNPREVQSKEQQTRELSITDDRDCDLAVKMMFNYNVGSTPTDIIEEFQAEQLPLLLANGNFGDTRKQWRGNTSLCFSHPNIMTVHQAFVDEVRVPSLQSAVSLFDMALPARLNSKGAGADTTMYIVMKRYKTTLREYLNKDCSLSDRSAMLIVAQLLEAVGYLSNRGLVHRDIKSNNILVDYEEGEAPHIVVADFGCALSLRGQNLQERVTARDQSRQGNTALMAPELKTAHHENHVCYQDYLKADAWAVGAIVYEICGQKNPFYSGLDSGTYEEQSLPKLQTEAMGLRIVAQLLLQRDPKHRPSPEVAANILHLFLWQPSASGLLRLCHHQSSLDCELSSWMIKVTLMHLLQDQLCGTTEPLSYDTCPIPIPAEQGLLGMLLRRVKADGLADAARFIVSHFLDLSQFGQQQTSSIVTMDDLAISPEVGSVAAISCRV